MVPENDSKLLLNLLSMPDRYPVGGRIAIPSSKAHLCNDLQLLCHGY